jgi:hypothetical protein
MAFTGNRILDDAETDAVTDATLIFPRDIGRPFSPESIKFAIYKREGASYKVVRDAGGAATKQLGATFNTLKKGLKATSDAAAADVANASGDEGKRTPAVSKGVIKEESKNIIEEGAKLVGKVKKFGETTVSAIVGAAERKKTQGEASVDNHLQSIYLNMPSSVVFNESVEWQGQDLGAMGAMTNGASAAEAAEVALLGNAGAILGGAAGAVTSALPGISGIAGTVVGAVAGAGGLQGALESTFNVKANPYKEQTFQGVGFRSFDFTFALRARSYEDVKVIQNIIRAFRAHSKPTFETKGKSGVFGYPKEFRIEYLTLDEEDSYVTNPFLPEIKYCVCTAVNTNFTQQGWRSFEGGAPVDISLQLTFQETEIITSEDVMGNTSVGRFQKGGHKF